MSEYLILPIVKVSLGAVTRVSWVVPCVGALQRVVALVENSLQATAIAGLPCAVQLGHYTMADVELRHLEDPIWLQRHVKHHLVMKTGDEIAVGVGPLLREAWRVKEVSLMTILRLPPPCFTPRDERREVA